MGFKAYLLRTLTIYKRQEALWRIIIGCVFTDKKRLMQMKWRENVCFKNADANICG
jgi:ABC-type ATPase involved in cell division